MALTPPRIVYRNLVDEATLSASPSLVSSLPVANLQNTLRTAMARSTSLASQDILGDWGAQEPVDCCVAWRHNWGPGSTWRLRLYSGANQTGTLLYDSGDIDAEPITPLGELWWGYEPWGTGIIDDWGWWWSTLWLDEVVSARSFKLTIYAPSNPYAYVELSRLILGAAWTLSDTANGMAPGASIEWRDDHRLARTDAGSLISTQGAMWRAAKFQLARLSDNDRRELFRIARLQGRYRDVFVSLLPGYGGAAERDYELLGQFSSLPPMTMHGATYWNGAVEIEEA